MKLSSKGFTLVELMIVIAIIGILAAALFPSLTSYLARGRDTSRAAGIKEISTGIAAYNVDTSAFPAGNGGAGTMCAHSGNLLKYVPKFPVDPSKQTNCSAEVGAYGYGTGDINGTTTVALSSKFENAGGGNTATGISTYQGDTLSTLSEIDNMKKGAAATQTGYVIRN
jgi:prepilin-type N-terminal cleavage/methylation domain-containing protein